MTDRVVIGWTLQTDAQGQVYVTGTVVEPGEPDAFLVQARITTPPTTDGAFTIASGYTFTLQHWEPAQWDLLTSS